MCGLAAFSSVGFALPESTIAKASSWLADESGPYMECQITPPSEGVWFLYARKTMRNEGFRWRIDNQSWRYVLKFGSSASFVDFVLNVGLLPMTQKRAYR